MEIEVTQDFIDHRSSKAEIYNKRGRSEKRFLMDLDAEIYEWYMINSGKWLDHDDWRVDAIDEKGKHIDVKFIGSKSKYWDVWSYKMLNVLAQRNILEHFLFMEWVRRPNRPLEVGDRVEIRRLGILSYDTVADNIKRSGFTDFYLPVRQLCGSL